MIYSWQPLLRLPAIPGRTFVCGDLHGCYQSLERQLAERDFRPAHDRLICVGDLIDRGPESHRALEFLAKPWFFSVLGNHDRMMLEVIAGRHDMFDTWRRSGGTWADALNPDEKLAWFRALAELPIVIEVVIGGDSVGIVHADVPPEMDWSSFCQAIQQGDRDAYAHATWGRCRIEAVNPEPVVGIDRVYAGHSIVEYPVTRGNVTFIDTGAFREDGMLTVLELDVRSHVIISLEAGNGYSWPES